MNKHTPGPWRAEVSMMTGGIVVDSETRPVALLGSASSAYKDELLANADLIAATPRLLEACRFIDQVLETSGPLGKFIPPRKLDDIRLVLRNALDQVDGKDKVVQ